ncbi:MAG TPA: hypothetical protein VK742_05120 [Candidatus Sulfotelmatobacter sp.]|jgi:hypothetical protein|nr:hypothetical protein [Candidatus Sulfotelmatobacter sp.]
MDRRHKKKAMVGLTLWLTAVPLAIVPFLVISLIFHALWPHAQAPIVIYILMVLGLMYFAFFWGGGHLARAKGYSTAILITGIFLPAQIVIFALLLFALPDKCSTHQSPKRKHRPAEDDSPIARIVRCRRNAMIYNVLGLAGILLALLLIFVRTGFFDRMDNSRAAAIWIFVPSYSAVIYGCWWWVRAKNWHEAVVFIGLMPLAVLLIPYVRLIYRLVPLLLPSSMFLMPIILLGVVAVLPDKSGILKRERLDADKIVAHLERRRIR